jgi:hypothetical protein
MWQTRGGGNAHISCDTAGAQWRSLQEFLGDNDCAPHLEAVRIHVTEVEFYRGMLVLGKSGLCLL